MKKKYDRGLNLHNFEDSMLRFDDQLAFVLKYYTPSLSLEMVHETITNDNGTNVSLKF